MPRLADDIPSYQPAPIVISCISKARCALLLQPVLRFSITSELWVSKTSSSAQSAAFSHLKEGHEEIGQKAMVLRHRIRAGHFGTISQ